MSRAELLRFAAMLGVFVTSGLAITWLLLPPAPIPKAELHPPPLVMMGKALPDDDTSVGEALDRVRRFAQGDLVLVLPDGQKHSFPKTDLGLEIDRARISQFIRDARDPGSALQRAYARAKKESDGADAVAVPMPITVDVARAVDRLVALKVELDRAPTDAFVDLEKKELKPDRIGYRLRVYDTVARISEALSQGESEVEVIVERIQPKLRAKDLGDVEFSQVLGYFETRYNRAKKNEDRTYNLRLAASKLDGAVVMPGQIFDFNEIVGPRDEARGYRVATVIAQGELVDGLGGGTCQISGTLHGAAFFAGLEITERYPHSRPSSYIKLGLDATVVYPTINFRFKNTFDYPIVVHQTVKAGTVRAEILGPARTHTVSYFRRIDEIIPFEEESRETDALPDGKRIVAQRGIPGFRTTNSRLVRDGAHGVREKWTDRYPPTTQIIKVGTGRGKKKIEGDRHPEYVVDEYLVMTQGPGIKSSDDEDPTSGGTTEKREPGKTGKRGWIEELGLAGSLPDIEAGDDDDDDDDDDDKQKKDKKKAKGKKKG